MCQCRCGNKGVECTCTGLAAGFTEFRRNSRKPTGAGSIERQSFEGRLCIVQDKLASVSGAGIGCSLRSQSGQS